MSATYIIAIGKIVRDNKTIGYRLLNTDGRTGQVKDIPTESILAAVVGSGLAIDNIAVVGGELVGTQGSLDRLPDIQLGSAQGANKLGALTILNKLGDVGYTVTNNTGKIVSMRTDECVEYSKKNGISNGKVVTKDGIDFISAINGVYREGQLNRKAAGERIRAKDVVDNSQGLVGRSLTRERNLSGIAKSIGVQVGEEVEFNDTFNLLTSKQKSVIQHFYVWWSILTFEGLAKSKKLQLTPKKAAELARIQGNLNWSYAGSVLAKMYNECGYDYCSLGHKLYKVHLAKGVDEAGNSQTVKFGSTCVGDFFDISPEGVRALERVTSTMTQEIAFISEMVKNGKVDEGWEDVSLMREIVDCIGDTDKLKSLFGDRLGTYLGAFKEINIPYPASLLRLSLEYVTENSTERVFWASVFKGDTCKYIAAIYDIESLARYKSIERDTLKALKRYFRVELEGCYAYDPIEKVGDRGLGRFTAKAASDRKQENRTLKYRLGIAKFNLGELRRAVDMLGMLVQISLNIQKMEQDVVSDAKYAEYVEKNTSVKYTDHASKLMVLAKREASVAIKDEADKAKCMIVSMVIKALALRVDTYDNGAGQLTFYEYVNGLGNYSFDETYKLYGTLYKTKACENWAEARLREYIELRISEYNETLREQQEEKERQDERQRLAERQRLEESQRLADIAKEAENKVKAEQKESSRGSEDLALDDMKVTEYITKHDKSNDVICPNEKCRFNYEDQCKIMMALGNVGSDTRINEHMCVTSCFMSESTIETYNKQRQKILNNEMTEGADEKELDSLEKLRQMIASGIYSVVKGSESKSYIAKDIAERDRYTNSSDLSPKQKYIIDAELEALNKELKDFNMKHDSKLGVYRELDTSSIIEDAKDYKNKRINEATSKHIMGDDTDGINMTYELSEHEQINLDIDLIVTAIDNNKIELGSKMTSILKTILSRGRFSDKQYKYVKEALEIWRANV